MRRTFIFIRLIFIITTILFLNNVIGQSHSGDNMKTLIVKKCIDFDVTGNGNNPEWRKTEWNPMTRLDTGRQNYDGKFKILYSATGIYVLLNGKDKKITTKFDHDFEDLYEGDVFEVFFHTNPKSPLYLEYEINQLNKELVLIIPNFKGRFYGWIPWHYEGERRMKKMVDIAGGKMETGASIRSWGTELFFPYKLFNPLENVPPKSGTVWNANFYRIDYDGGNIMEWAWAPVKKSFHEFEKFWPIRFE